MKHRKKLMILLTLTACMVLFCSFPVFAAELTEAQVEQAVAEQGKETVTGNVFVWFLCAIPFLEHPEPEKPSPCRLWLSGCAGKAFRYLSLLH